MAKLTFIIQQSVLNKALSICSKALSDNKILPICEMFLFDLSGPELKLSACDMRIIISTQIAIQSKITDFKICVPGKKIQDYIAKSANELLLFEIEKHVEPEIISVNELTKTEYISQPQQVSYSLLVKSGTNKQNKAKFNCILGGDFPIMSNESPEKFQLPAEDLLEMLYKTMFAICDDELKPASTGLNVCIKPGKIIATGLNFHIISTYTCDSELNFEHPGFIIPKKALQQIQSLNPVGFLSCEISKSALSVSWGEVQMTLLLIDEKYPDYLSITPIDNHIDFVTSRSELINSLKRVLPFSDIGKLVKLEVSSIELKLVAENIDYNEDASETISGALSSGDGIIIGVNGEFLLNILNTLTEKVWFSFKSPNRAVIITSGDKHENPGKENLVLLMPKLITV